MNLDFHRHVELPSHTQKGTYMDKEVREIHIQTSYKIEILRYTYSVNFHVFYLKLLL